MGETLHIIEKDPQLFKIWSCLSHDRKQMIKEIDEGIRVPDFLCDTIFKGIFDPDVHGDRLSRFISSVLGKEVKVLHSSGNEGFRHSVHSKGIILEKSSAVFHESAEYIHHFKQRSDTGLELELVQYYDYVCLDMFKKKSPRVASELESWLRFFTIERVDDMKVFLQENPGFQSVYDYAIMMTKDREGLLSMLSEYFENEDIVASLNKTNESMIKRLEKENAELKGEITELQGSNIEKDKVIDRKEKQLDEKEKKLREKDAEIRQLKKLLANQENG